MKSNTKIWIGVGAFVIAGSAAVQAGAPTEAVKSFEQFGRAETRNTDTAVDRISRSGVLLAQQRSRQGGEGGERARNRQGGEAAKAAPSARQGGEGAGEEGGGKGAKPRLAPDLDFALKIAELRGHLLVGDELVKQGQWAAALPHFVHPTEELYGDLRGRLKEYNAPPFETALKSLARTVKAKKDGDDYAKALRAVEDALAAADAGLRTKQSNWDAFTVETIVELIKESAHEYQQAIVKGRIAKAVEYQDARGFIWHAEKMLESVAPALEKKDADSLKRSRAAIRELKKAFPSPLPPKTPVKDYGAVLGDVSRVELAVGRLM